MSKKIVENIKFNKLNTKVNTLENETSAVATLVHINQHNIDKKNLEFDLVTPTAFNIKTSKIEKKVTVFQSRKQIIKLKYQTLRKNILLFMIVINLRVKYLMQR